jgi:hypothetical protein
VAVAPPAADTRLGPTRDEPLLVEVAAAFAAEPVALFAAGIIVVSDFVAGVARPTVEAPLRAECVRGADVLDVGVFGLGGGVVPGCGGVDGFRCSWPSLG